MEDDFSDLGAPAPVMAAPPIAPIAPPPTAPITVAPGGGTSGVTDDFSDLGAHPASGPTGNLSVDIPRRLASAGIDAVSGIVGVPRQIAQGIDWLGNKAGVDVGADQALAGLRMYDGSQSFPDVQAEREKVFQGTGATEYVPATMGGRAVQAGLAAAPAALLTGGAGAVLPAMAGGATGEAAAEMLPDHPVAARVAGFVLGAGGASGALNTGAKAIGMATGTAPTTDLFQSYERQGVPTTLTGDVTQSPAFQRLQSMATKLPGGEDAMREAGTETIDAWHAALERTAAQLGPASTMAEAGTGLQTAARQWLQDFKQNSTAKWNDFRNAVPSDTPIKVDGFQKALQDVNQNFGGADELAKVLQPGLGTKLKEALTADVSSQGTLPWQAVQSVRTRLGEMMESGQPIGDTAQSAIKRLYAGLSDDMRDGATAAGPTAAKAFNQANAYTAFGHGMLEDHLGPILKATEPGQAAQYALAQSRLGSSRLAALDNAMPGQTANLGAAVLRQNTEAGPGGLPTALKKISPEARPLLFSSPQPPAPPATAGAPIQIAPPPTAPNPALQGVNDLNDISLAMRRTIQSTGNNSNTAAHTASGIGRVIAAAEMGKFGHDIAGAPGAVAGTAAGFFAPPILGRGARMLAANPLLSRLYSTDLAPFNAPGMTSPNALLQYGQPDRRSLPYAGPRMNPLLFAPSVVGSDPIPAKR